MTNETNRRDFLKIAALAGVGTVLKTNSYASAAQSKTKTAGSMIEYAAAPIDVVRIGFVGVGGMGTGHLRNFLRIESVEIRAVCDIKPERMANAQKLCVEAGKPKPDGYTGPEDYLRLCQRDDIDLVFNVTPWQLHTPVCLAAMNAGKHAATEVPAAITIDQCMQLVETSEKTRLHCVMMENCCYGREEMLILNMVKKNMFGEIIHGTGSYMHDLRAIKLNRDATGKIPAHGEAEWRLEHAIKRSGDVYPTHSIGPVAHCMDINRGDCFDHLVTMSSISRGLNAYAAKRFGPDNPLASQKYALGDVVTTLIRTAKGRTIAITHDTHLPRPYSRGVLVQGTAGIARQWPDEIYIEGRSTYDQWDPMSKYYDEFDHPLIKKLRELAKGAGHGGMDFIEDYRLINALRHGLVPDMDVYDAASWSVISALSAKSVENGSEPVKFPDFTKGKWRTPRTLHMMDV